MKYANCLILALASLSFCSEAIALDYFVNPNGNDVWSGTLKLPDSQSKNGPFKTLERAKQAIRELKQKDSFTAPVTVHIAPGHYYLSQSLHFDLQDSGLPGREIVWQGDTAGEVIISGGIPLNCKKKDDRIWECPLNQMPVNKEFFNTKYLKGNAPKFELYVDDQKLDLARWPNQGWVHIKKPLDEKTRFSVFETMPDFKGDIKNAQVHIYPGWDWHDEYLAIASFDTDSNSIKLASQTFYPLASGHRFYIYNLPSLLDVPGEWMFDAATKIAKFIAPAGVINPQKIIVSSLSNILVADSASYLSFKNMGFLHSAGTGLKIKNSKNIVMDFLDISNMGGEGLIIESGQNVGLTNSKIHHTGGQGVIVFSGDEKTLKSAGHVIHNNHIHHIGTVVLTNSPGIEINGVGLTVTHNLLEEGGGPGIVIRGNDHLIEKNEIHHFCMQSSDCGSIYMGRNWAWRGNVIRHNYIHDIIGYGLEAVDIEKNLVKDRSPADARGIYLDDGSSGFQIEGNLFENAGNIAFFIGGGRDNKIVNNFFKTGEYAIAVDELWPTYDWTQILKNLNDSPYKSSLWRQKYPELAAPMHNYKWPEGNKFEKNIIVSSKPGGLAFRYSLPVISTTIRNNLVWGTSGGISVEYHFLDTGGNKKLTWTEWLNEKVEKDSIYDDPCATLSNDKLTLCPTSAAKAIGFAPIPGDIGLIK